MPIIIILQIAKLICLLYFNRINAHSSYNISSITNSAYKRITDQGGEIKFVKAEPVHDCWIELNVDATDVEQVLSIIYIDKNLSIFDTVDSINAYCTGGKHGIYNWLREYECYINFFEGDEQNKKDNLSSCMKLGRKYNFPPVIGEALHCIFTNLYLSNDYIRSYLEGINKDLKTYAIFDPDNIEKFEAQVQYILKKTDGVYLSTNILKIIKKDGHIHRENFGEDCYINFEEWDEIVPISEAASNELPLPDLDIVLGQLQREENAEVEKKENVETEKKEEVNEELDTYEQTTTQNKNIIEKKEAAIGGLTFSVISLASVAFVAASVILFILWRRYRKE